MARSFRGTRLTRFVGKRFNEYLQAWYVYSRAGDFNSTRFRMGNRDNDVAGGIPRIAVELMSKLAET